MKLRIRFLSLFLSLCLSGIVLNAHAAREYKSISVNALERTAMICAPSNMIAALPVMLVFHGRGSNARAMANGTQMHEAWPEALTVYLDGKVGNPAPYDPEGSMSGWQINTGELDDRDVAFVDAVLDALIKYYKVDSKKVFAVGHSNGARFVGILWAMRASRFAGLAFSAGQADTLIEAASPRPVFMAMGIHDEVISFDGQRRSINYAAKRFGMNAVDAEKAGIRRYKNKDGIELMTFIYDGGHTWPAEQTGMIVDFFKRQSEESKSVSTNTMPKTVQ